MKCFEQMKTDRNYAIAWGIISVFVVAVFVSIFLIAKTITEFAVLDNINSNYNSFSVEGIGEVTAVADIAQFTFTANESASEVSQAQEVVDKKIEGVIAFIKSQGVADEDIKTENYSVYPKYEWQQPQCITFDCPPGKSILTGYEVSQTISVKIREAEKAGDIISEVGNQGITNISGLQFVVDDEESLKEEARQIAIKNAKEKAEVIAKNLGVDLGDVLGYWEDAGNDPRFAYAFEGYGGGGDIATKSLSLPRGENTVIVRVNITYNIED